MDVEGLREDLRLLYDELADGGWKHPYWREVRKLARELDQALYQAQRVKPLRPPDLGVFVSDGVKAKDEVRG